jgi:PEP-CTERM motif
MKMNFKKTCIALALAGGFVSAANATPVVISSGGTSATIADSGLFSSSTALGLSNGGLEYINLGIWASNYTLRDSTGIIATANQALGDSSNPFSAAHYGAISNEVSNTGSFGGWNFSSTETVTSPGHLVYAITITNNTGHDATDVSWGFGIDPDQGVPGGFGNGTTNVIDGAGSFASVTATSSDGYWVSLRNITGANATDIHTYVDPTACCSPVDPMTIHLAAQPVGSYGFSDSSINIAYVLGHSGVMHNGDSSVVGYELVMGAVPEPETYAMFMAGLGLMGFIARRRKNGQV